MTNTKNNERKSTINGRIITDIDIMTSEPFSVETDYVRNTNFEKARKLAAQVLNAEPNMIIVREIINEKTERTRYSSSKIFDNAATYFDDEEAIEELFNSTYDKEQYTIVPFTMFNYEGAFWAYDEVNDIYVTDYVHDNSPLKMTKINMRQFLAYSAHDLTGYEIIGLHNAKREEATYYAIIDKEVLEHCVED